MAQRDEKYTDPDLRRRIKDELQRGDKGGAPGRWSARKSQLLAHEYEKRGGGYRGEKSAEQQHLDQWTEEDWQTSDGSGDARHDGSTERYLPKAAWDQLSDEEKAATEKAKRRGSRQGEQHVANTDAAKKARRSATSPVDGHDDLTAKELVREIADLGPADFDAVRRHEEAGKNRKTVLEAVDRASERS